MLLPLPVQRSLVKLGRDIGVARRKRRLTAAMMAERIGATKVTYLKLEKGDPRAAMGYYAAALHVLGLGTPFSDLADPAADDEGLLLDAERLPKRVRPRTEPRTW